MKKIFSLLLTVLMTCGLIFSIPLTASASTVASGTCGNNLTWVLDDTGTLTISGTGDMYDYERGMTPYNGYREEIERVIIEYGVTSIGNHAFNFSIGKMPINRITNVTLSDSITSIGDYAFYECTNLTNITIPNSMNNMGRGAFYGCSSLEKIIIPNSVTNISCC